MKLGSTVSRTLGAVAGFLSISLAAAADDNPKNLSCSFADGASWSYDAGAFHSKPPAPLAFTIENIDLEKQTATLKAAPGAVAGKVSVVRAINANHFLEVVNEGFLNLTTVYDKDETTGKHPAVHSRHLGIVGSPVFGQYTGFCSDE
ncbi:MAG: hypothetical protein AB7S70_00480 [Hyphomicrobium sp.]|uniref:hypothetical protein n=1 Tax=Hyphomicrobium sp. TaxID=82 RepID=UPI003D0BB43D